MSETRTVMDVRHLPTTTFGPRDLMWWGTVGFMTIEGTTFFIAAVSYVYLRLNVGHWPPEHTLRPSLFWPTVQVALMLASNAPNYLAQRAAHRLDLPALRRWMVMLAVFGIVFLVLRWQEFLSLNVRWDTNAYASVAWITVGLHGTVLALQVIETLIFTIFLFGRQIAEKHFSDASDSSLYWYFMTGSWIVLYVVIFLGPRLT